MARRGLEGRACFDFEAGSFEGGFVGEARSLAVLSSASGFRGRPAKARGAESLLKRDSKVV